MFQIHGVRGWHIATIVTIALTGTWLLSRDGVPNIPGPTVASVAESIELATKLCNVGGENIKSWKVLHKSNTTKPTAIRFECTGYLSGVYIDHIQIGVHKRLTAQVIINRVLEVCGTHGVPPNYISIKQLPEQGRIDYYVTCKDGVQTYDGSFEF